MENQRNSERSPRPRLSPKTVPQDQGRPSRPTQQERWASVRWDQRRLPATNDPSKSSREPLNVPPDAILSPQSFQSVQKILRLTGYTNSTTTLSADSSTLHNSSQKIKQLTGFEVRPSSSWAADQDSSVEDDMTPNVSTSETASIYSNESLEADALSVGHADSTFLSPHFENVDDVYTPLTAPKHAVAAVNFRDSRSYSVPMMRDHLRLSGFLAADSWVCPSIQDKRPFSNRESWHCDNDSDKELLRPSSLGQTDITELEHAVGKLYDQATPPLSSKHRDPALSQSSNSPALELLRGHVDECNLPDDMDFAGHKGNTIVAEYAPLHGQPMDGIETVTLPPPSFTSFSMSGTPFRPESFSERRLTASGRGPSPLSLPLTITTPLSPPPSPARKNGRWASSIRPPFDSSDLIKGEEAKDSPVRLSLMSRILSGAPGKADANSSNNNYSTIQSISASSTGDGTLPSTITNFARPESSNENEKQLASPRSPDTPKSESGITAFAAAAFSSGRRATDGGSTILTGTVTTTIVATASLSGAGGSSLTSLDGESPRGGVWKKALDHAKSRAGMKSKADKKKNK